MEKFGELRKVGKPEKKYSNSNRVFLEPTWKNRTAEPVFSKYRSKGRYNFLTITITFGGNVSTTSDGKKL